MEQGDKPRVFEVHTDLDCLQTWWGLKEIMPNFMSFMCYTAKLLSIEEQYDIWKTQRAQMLHTKGVSRYYELLVKLLSLPDAGITPERKFNETFLRG